MNDFLDMLAALGQAPFVIFLGGVLLGGPLAATIYEWIIAPRFHEEDPDG